jgi:hypothetical protein
MEKVQSENEKLQVTCNKLRSELDQLLEFKGKRVIRSEFSS